MARKTKKAHRTKSQKQIRKARARRVQAKQPQAPVNSASMLPVVDLR